ncbi:MAG: LytR C-terminal domain-containing protein [Solirubrobacterales bacterium]|nr:LytR C-terminal domain-containing protein [Solirubrobacterales bacterium]
MAQVPFASISVHHIISTVGADVGFASLIGLALLVLLFFSQARETATLRSRAEEAGLRIQELEAELADLSEQVAAMPAEISVRAASPRAAAAYGALAPGAPAGAGQAMALPPAAPAGVGAPALAAATRLIPDPVRPLPEFQPATSAGNGNGSSARPVVAASAATIQRPVQAPPAGPPGGRPGGPPRPVGAPPRVGGGGGARPGRGPGGAPVRPVGAGQGRPPGQSQSRPASGRPSGAPLRPPPRRSPGRIALGALIAAVALAAVVVGVIVLTGGGKGASSASRSTSSGTLAASRRARAAQSAVLPASVTVSVLNGTDLQGLAGNVANQLAADGYQKGSKPTNAADQTHTSTIVAYMAAADRPGALAVAKSLKLGPSAVQPIDPTTKATVCPPGQPCASTVVVTVGTDQAHQ